MADKKTKTTKKAKKKTTTKKKVETKKKVGTKKKVEAKKEVKLNSLVWELPYNEDLVTQVLYVYNINERKGTAKQKNRGEVSGGGIKPWKQKGTGRARHGSIRSPLWIGGGVTFAASGRNFKRKINKRMARKATSIMLSERLRNNELDFVKLTPTKGRKLRKEGKEKTLVISNDEKLGLVLRNSERNRVISPEKLNAKHLIAAKKILVDESAVKILEERLTNGK
jgi:large subunit ribosomal protein L4